MDNTTSMKIVHIYLSYKYIFIKYVSNHLLYYKDALQGLIVCYCEEHRCISDDVITTD